MGLIFLIIIGVGIFYAVQHSKKKNVKRIPTPTRLASPISNGTNINTNKETASKEKSITSSPSSLVSQRSKYPEIVNSSTKASNFVTTQNLPKKNMQSLNDESENNLVTFTISVGQSEPKSSNKSLGQWIKRGEQIKLKGYESDKGFFYFGGQLEAYKTNAYYNSYETEASLVDECLLTERRDKSYTDGSLGYWPTYIALSPQARGAYLDWLFGERSDHETPIGYVFIYFYGLERRVLIDGTQGKVDNSEYISIFNELKRLRQIFTDHYAFHNYSSKLIEIMAYLRPEIIQIDYSEFPTRYDSILFKYHLAKQVQDGKPITDELALLWIKNTDEYNLRTPARRCAEEFSNLFKQLYLKETIGGLVVKPNKTKLRLDYYPASGTLRGFQLDIIDLPDPSILKAPIKKLANIADQCTEALEQYSRYLGRKGTNKEDIEAVLLLPEALRKHNTSNSLLEFKSWAEDKIIKDNGLVLFSELWSFTGKLTPEKLNKKELDLLDNFLSFGNYFYVPNVQIHKVKPSIDGYIVLTHDGLNGDEKLSESFKKLLLFIRLAVMIAKCDSTFHEKEKVLINKTIDEDSSISLSERSSLNAYFIWSMNSSVNTAGLKQQIESMDETNKITFRKILVQIALADGKIEATEIKQLEKLYTMLGIDKSLIPSDLHQYTTQKTISPQKQPTEGNITSFILDDSILAQYEAETKEVHTLLGSIFVEENIPEEKIEPMTLGSSLTISLDKQHRVLFETLIDKEKWLREDIETICQKLNLMIDGALETINDWAYEIADAPVLEDDGDIYVDQEIVAELREE